MNSKKTRFLEIDLLRSLAIVGMIIFHIFFILDYYGIAEYNTDSGTLLLLARFVQFSFLGLVGVSLSISSKKHPKKRLFKRGATIFAIGMLVTAVTYIAVPDQYVRFGILHLIGLSIIILSPLAHQKWANLIIGIIAFAVGHLLITIKTTSTLLAILGHNGTNLNSLDHFAIFPWISTIAFGVFFGNLLYPKIRPLVKITPPRALIYISKRSLIIYMLHIPLIVLILRLFHNIQNTF